MVALMTRVLVLKLVLVSIEIVQNESKVLKKSESKLEGKFYLVVVAKFHLVSEEIIHT